MRDIEVQIIHHRVVTVGVVVLQQLLAEDAFGCRVAIVQAVDVGEAESPIEVIGLNRIRETLEIKSDLVELNGVGNHVGGGFVVGIPALVRRTGISPNIEPAVNLYTALVPVDRLYQGVGAVIRR